MSKTLIASDGTASIELRSNQGADAEAADVLRCLAVILGTRAGELALDRDFGLSSGFLDSSTELAQATLSSEIVEKISRYEPRATVTQITFTGSESGTLKPRVEVTLNV